jgi:hypothetical protein
MITETEINELCVKLKARLLEEQQKGTNISVHIHPHHSGSFSAQTHNDITGETISIRIGRGPDISY